MTFWQEVALALVSAGIGMLSAALVLVWKFGPRLTNLDYRLAHVERGVERIEAALSKINLAEFENRIFERGDGRYMKVGYGDERLSNIKERLDRVEADVESLRSRVLHIDT